MGKALLLPYFFYVRIALQQTGDPGNDLTTRRRRSCFSKGEKMEIHESGEMYLETIYILSRKKDGVHAVDVARALGVSRPSVSNALSRLEKDGCITIDEEMHIRFLPKGLFVAEKTYGRHTLLTGFLTYLGVGPENAEADACKMEHDLSEETIEVIRAYMEKARAKAEP